MKLGEAADAQDHGSSQCRTPQGQKAGVRRGVATTVEKEGTEMKAAGYCRVSTQDQTEKYGLEAQKRILTEHFQRQGWKFELFIDAGISGEHISTRPEFQRLLRGVGDGRFDMVLAADMDRYSRADDQTDWQRIKSVFREAGVPWGTPGRLNQRKTMTRNSS